MCDDVEKNQQEHVPGSVQDMYDSEFLIECSLFVGGFLNFGYWKTNAYKHRLSKKDRLESEKNMYRYVLKKLKTSKKNRILEVACGAGAGAKLLLEEFPLKEYCGIDMSNVQVARAKKLLADGEKYRFIQGTSEALPFSDNSFDKIFSIEAAQHFQRIPLFLAESYRVLKKEGSLAICTFFATTFDTANAAKELIPTLQNQVDFLHPLPEVQKSLQEAGFRNIRVSSIGKNVWPGFDRWISQGEFKSSWDRNWYQGYKKGLFDYFLIVACK